MSRTFILANRQQHKGENTKPATGVAKNNCSYRCLYSHYSEYKYPLFSLSKRHLCHLYIRGKIHRYRNRYRTNETHRIPVRPNRHYRGERTEFHIQASRKFTINSSAMKMFYKIFISCIFLWIGNICHAQKGLAIAPLFSGKYDKDEQAIVVLLKGKTLHPYGLSLFHSISITDRPDDVTLFEAAVSTDSRKAENSETVKSGNNTIAGYYQLPPAAPDGENRFILFRKTSPHDATLIYLEGQTQLDKLINLFINKKQ